MDYDGQLLCAEHVFKTVQTIASQGLVCSLTRVSIVVSYATLNFLKYLFLKHIVDIGLTYIDYIE